MTVTDARQTFTLFLAANDAPDAIGKVLGIEFDNVTENGESGVGLDDALLTVK